MTENEERLEGVIKELAGLVKDLAKGCGELQDRIDKLEKEKTTTVVHNHYHTSPPQYTFPAPPVMGRTIIGSGYMGF